MDIIEQFQHQSEQYQEAIRRDERFRRLSREWVDRSVGDGYCYNFAWLGRPYADRPWDAHNNPKTAVNAFLMRDRRFVVDRAISDKLQISSCPGGFLRCVADREPGV